MADRMLMIGWGAPVRGREERGLEVFNEALGICGRMQQEGQIEKFEVRLMGPNGGDLDGYIEMHGSAEQIAAVKEDDEFLRNTMDANQIVEGLRHYEGWINEGIARAMEMYQDSIAKVPQRA
ncbi:MAG: hypothetical protein QOE06_1929 [Thermoleophilaceae bacterium]|jgi:hypothetical protein|nr:hypothetical protein [Thermoleophilaceae bacterium]